MELDDDQDTLTTTFAAMTLAVNDYEQASGDEEKAQIAGKMVELLFGIKRTLAKCNPALIKRAFSPNMCKNWLSQFGRCPSSSDQFDLTRDIIENCLTSLGPESFLKNGYSNMIVAFLDNDGGGNSEESKRCILNQISKLIERAKSETIREMGDDDSSQVFLSSITGCLTDPSTAVAEAASKILVHICQRPPPADGVELLFSKESVVKRLRSMLTEKEVVRFRFYELIGAISIIDERCLKLCSNHGFVDALLKEIDTDDILCQLNALTILADMAAPKSGSDHCLRYFRDKGLFGKLNSMLVSARESPDSTFLFPAAIKFFGHLSRLYPQECCEDFPLFPSCVFDMVVNYNLLDIGQRLLAFDTLALIGSTAAGKTVLAKRDDAMRKCMFAFGNSFKQGPVELRVRHIEALGLLLALKGPDQRNESLLGVTRRWFGWLEGSGREEDACKLMLDLFRQPFPEIHHAAGEIFKELAAQNWAARLMAQQAGFLEYLLDRGTEHTLEGRYVKYEIIKCLSESPSIDDSIDPADALRLKAYVKEGALYVKSQAPEVAFEEA